MNNEISNERLEKLAAQETMREQAQMAKELLALRKGFSVPDGWIKCSEQMPESIIDVIAFYLNRSGKRRVIRAEYIPYRQVEADCAADEVCADYDEDKDIYYLCEGWYELVDNWDEYRIIKVTEGEVTHWQPLPSPPEASNEKLRVD